MLVEGGELVNLVQRRLQQVNCRLQVNLIGINKDLLVDTMQKLFTYLGLKVVELGELSIVLVSQRGAVSRTR